MHLHRILAAVRSTELKPKSVIKAVFSEKVKGVSKKSMKLYKLKGKKKVLVKSKVTVIKKGKAAKLDPKGRLRPGDYLLVFFTNKIKDKRGNNLVASNVTPELRVASGHPSNRVSSHERRVVWRFGTTP
jgi:hypothetical protein